MNDKDAKLTMLVTMLGWTCRQAGRGGKSGAVMDLDGQQQSSQAAGRRCGVSFFSRTLFRLHVQPHQKVW